MKINLSQCCPLFSGISENEMDKLLSCLDARERRYQKGELVISAGTKISRFGVLLSGTVEIQQEDFQGNITIVAQITPGQLFAEAFVGAGAALPVAVLSTEPSVILWLDYNKLLSPCQYACPFHAAVIKNMVKILANKNIFLNARIGHLYKRTLKEKVLSYLTGQARQHNSRSFTIPFNRQKMADYLAADRSALSAVLGKLKNEGILDFQKNRFTIQQNLLIKKKGE